MKTLLIILLILKPISTTYNDEFLATLDDMTEIMYNDGFYNEGMIGIEPFITIPAQKHDYIKLDMEKCKNQMKDNNNILYTNEPMQNNKPLITHSEANNVNTQLLSSNRHSTYHDLDINTTSGTKQKSILQSHHGWNKTESNFICSKQSNLCNALEVTKIVSDNIIQHNDRRIEVQYFNHTNKINTLENTCSPSDKATKGHVYKRLPSISIEHLTQPYKPINFIDTNIPQGNYLTMKNTGDEAFVPFTSNLILLPTKRKYKEIKLGKNVKQSKFGNHPIIGTPGYSSRMIDSDISLGKNENKSTLSILKDEYDIVLGNRSALDEAHGNLLGDIVSTENMCIDPIENFSKNQKITDEFDKNMNKGQAGFEEIKKKIILYHLQIKSGKDNQHIFSDYAINYIKNILEKPNKHFKPCYKLDKYLLASHVLYLIQFFNIFVTSKLYMASGNKNTINLLYHLTYQARNHLMFSRYDKYIKIFNKVCMNLANIFDLFRVIYDYNDIYFSDLYENILPFKYEAQKAKLLKMEGNICEFSMIEALYESNDKDNLTFVNTKDIFKLFKEYLENILPQKMNKMENMILGKIISLCKKTILYLLYDMSFRLMDNSDLKNLLLDNLKIKIGYGRIYILDDLHIDDLFFKCNIYIKMYIIFVIKRYTNFFIFNINSFLEKANLSYKKSLLLYENKTIYKNGIFFNPHHMLSRAKFITKIKICHLNIIAIGNFAKKYDEFYTIHLNYRLGEKLL